MTAIAQQDQSQELAERGWRMETIASPDGTEVSVQVPLTDAEFLHPQEGYHLPNSTFHDNITGRKGYACASLRQRPGNSSLWRSDN